MDIDSQNSQDLQDIESETTEICESCLSGQAECLRSQAECRYGQRLTINVDNLYDTCDCSNCNIVDSQPTASTKLPVFSSCVSCEGNLDESYNSLGSLLDGIDINNNKRKIMNVECNNSDFMCSFCGAGITYIDETHMYEYDQLYMLNESSTIRSIVKNAYAYEKEPNEWLIFCRRMCEINYNSTNH
jgi:hypothetical protein